MPLVTNAPKRYPICHQRPRSWASRQGPNRRERENVRLVPMVPEHHIGNHHGPSGTRVSPIGGPRRFNHRLKKTDGNIGPHVVISSSPTIRGEDGVATRVELPPNATVSRRNVPCFRFFLDLCSFSVPMARRWVAKRENQPINRSYGGCLAGT